MQAVADPLSSLQVKVEEPVAWKATVAVVALVSAGGGVSMTVAGWVTTPE